ncbi:hypothetical protein JHK85_027885 [Glycine max]|nr:hypothetical protein JHK85_027885 [Glycine max]
MARSGAIKSRGGGGSMQHQRRLAGLVHNQIEWLRGGTTMVKVVMPKGSLLPGIEGEVISVYTVKLIFDGMKKNIYGRIVTIEYDPNRNAYICLIHYGDGEKKYILHPRGAIIGDTIVSGTEVPIKMGNVLPLSAV